MHKSNKIAGKPEVPLGVTDYQDPNISSNF